MRSLRTAGEDSWPLAARTRPSQEKRTIYLDEPAVTITITVARDGDVLHEQTIRL